VGLDIGKIVSHLGKNIDCIYQDKNGYFWFGSNGEGAFFWDGKKLKQITTNDGLLSNYVWNIEEDINGIICFSSRVGVCSFDGKIFTDFTTKINFAFNGRLIYKKGGLFFSKSNGLCFYDGLSFTGFAIHPVDFKPATNTRSNPYSVYSSLADKDGHVWFGTQEKGVCRYDGYKYTYYTDMGLDSAAVRTLFQDHAGVIWAGNNGAGLFRFNGKEFENFSDQMGLGNRDFLNKLKGKEGTLARPWSINEDPNGMLWIGTIDAGVWLYDGKVMKNYTTKDGLPGNSIWKIFKDNKGELWFIVDGNSICKFNGKGFYKVDCL
jgi:ligand-binding sensor domain-containing protein